MCYDMKPSFSCLRRDVGPTEWEEDRRTGEESNEMGAALQEKGLSPYFTPFLRLGHNPRPEHNHFDFYVYFYFYVVAVYTPFYILCSI